MHKVNVFQPTHVLTSSTAADIQAWTRSCLQLGERLLLIDLEKVSFIDSSGLGALLRIHKMVKDHGGELAFCHAQEQARMLFDMTSTNHLFSIYADPSEFEHHYYGSS